MIKLLLLSLVLELLFFTLFLVDHLLVGVVVLFSLGFQRVLLPQQVQFFQAFDVIEELLVLLLLVLFAQSAVLHVLPDLV